MDIPAWVSAAQALTANPAGSLAGRRLGVYQVISWRAGGMGEVYRARDTRLERDVAIKILPRVFSSDPERLARFEREARVLAALNHPYIGAIYGLEDMEGSPALVLELVEGETLDEYLAHNSSAGGPGLRWPRRPHCPRDPDRGGARSRPSQGHHPSGSQARQHQDPRPDGTIKVLDFGLANPPAAARRRWARPGPPPTVYTLTTTVPLTKGSVRPDTAAYMSPEQAQGRSRA